MRYVVARVSVILTLVLGPGLWAIGARPEWYPPDDVVAKQVAASAENRKAVLAYYQRVIHGQYDKVGSRSPQWDAQMHRLIDVNVEGRMTSFSEEGWWGRMVAIRECQKAGCDDALMCYLFGRAAAATNLPREQVRWMESEGCKKMVDSGYGGILRYHGLVYLAVYIGRPAPDRRDDMLAEAEQSLDEALEMLPMILKDPDLPDCEIGNIIESAGMASQAMYGDRWQWAQKVFEVIEQKFPGRPAVHVAKAELFRDYAWDARGSGWANSVTEEGWKLMEERLKVAEAAATKAWEMDPQCLRAATAMLGVELGQGKGQAVMERWFRRAVAIDPKDYAAYSRKL